MPRVGKYRDIFENIENIRFFRYFLFFRYFWYFRYISSICTYVVLTVSAAVLLLSLGVSSWNILIVWLEAILLVTVF